MIGYIILVVAIFIGALIVAGVPARILAWWFQRQRRREEAKKADRDAVLRAWQRRNRERGITANAERLIAETENYLRAWTEEEMS